MEDFIQKLKNDPAFLEFEEFVVEKIEELKNDESYENHEDQRAGQEAKINIKVRRKLHEILAPFFNFSEKKEPTPEQVNKAKEKNLL